MPQFRASLKVVNYSVRVVNYAPSVISYAPRVISYAPRVLSYNTREHLEHRHHPRQSSFDDCICL